MTCANNGCQRDSYFDTSRRLLYPFCSQTCAREDGRNLPTKLTCKTQNCARPVFWDASGPKDYCGITCRDRPQNTGQFQALAARQIDFYNSNMPSSFLGNFYECRIQFGQYGFGCSEALYQAAKYLNIDEPIDSSSNQNILNQFANLKPDQSKGADGLGHAAWNLGQQLMKNGHVVRRDWMQNNLSIMEEILRLKYSQNQNLTLELIRTGTQPLNERTDRDIFWGDGKTRTGRNELGKLHMKLRSEAIKNGRIECNQELHKILGCKPSARGSLTPLATQAQPSNRTKFIAFAVAALAFIVFLAYKRN